MSLGNNIKHARKAAGLTQEDIAKEIGVSKQTVQKYESGVITTISSDKTDDDILTVQKRSIFA